MKFNGTFHKSLAWTCDPFIFHNKNGVWSGGVFLAQPIQDISWIILLYSILVKFCDWKFFQKKYFAFITPSDNLICTQNHHQLKLPSSIL